MYSAYLHGQIKAYSTTVNVLTSVKGRLQLPLLTLLGILCHASLAGLYIWPSCYYCIAWQGVAEPIVYMHAVCDGVYDTMANRALYYP